MSQSQFRFIKVSYRLRRTVFMSDAHLDHFSESQTEILNCEFVQFECVYERPSNVPVSLLPITEVYIKKPVEVPVP